MRVLCVVGARPNFMKAAPVLRGLEGLGVEGRLVHTGQHFDASMSDVFFRDLGLPEPAHHLGVAGGGHTEQTARVMLAFEPVLAAERPDWVVVVGDVNSTLACGLVAAKAGVRLAHVEAGLRSFDRAMPEEVNRVVVDRISDLLLVSEPSGLQNLAREGVEAGRVRFVGNVMIDTLVRLRSRARESRVLEEVGVEEGYGLVTMHRPSNVDTEEALGRVVEVVRRVAARGPVVFPCHPRTRGRLETFGLGGALEEIEGVRVVGPQAYVDFVRLMEGARVVVTDSGGIQEETTFLGVPCLTFRTTTERPVTVELGTNRLLASLDPERLEEALDEVGARREVSVPLWDGRAGERVAAALVEWGVS